MADAKAKKITINEPAILLMLSRTFEQIGNSEDLYEFTRGNWVVGDRREKAKYAIATYKGIVREVYRINSWSPVDVNSSTSPTPIARLAKKGETKVRWRFDGEIAQELSQYIGGSVEHYFNRTQNPVRYINC